MKVKLYRFNTKFGEMKIYFTNDGVVALSLPQETEEESNYFKKHYPEIVEVDSDEIGYSNQIIDYFEGKVKSFNIPISLKGTEFQTKVWNELLNISYGETKTYKEIGQAIGCEKGSRAVGGALNKNPIAIIVP